MEMILMVVEFEEYLKTELLNWYHENGVSTYDNEKNKRLIRNAFITANSDTENDDDPSSYANVIKAKIEDIRQEYNKIVRAEKEESAIKDLLAGNPSTTELSPEESNEFFKSLGITQMIK